MEGVNETSGLRPVSERALVARINRKLAKTEEALRICKVNSRAYNELGRYYTVNIRTNTVLGMDQDLEKLGREVGAVRANETCTVQLIEIKGAC